MANVCRISDGTTTIDFVGGTTSSGGTSTLDLVALDLGIPSPFITVTSSPWQEYERQTTFRYGATNRHIVATVDVMGQSAGHVQGVIRDLNKLIHQGNAYIEVSAHSAGTPTVKFDVLRGTAVQAPYDFGTINLDGALVQGLVLDLTVKPLAYQASTTATATAAAINGQSIAGVRYFSLSEAQGDCAPPTSWAWAKSASGDDVSKVWTIARAASSNPHALLHNPGTGGTGGTFTNGSNTVDATDANAISSAAGAIVTWTATTTNDEIVGHFEMTGSTPSFYRVMGICRQNNGAVGDIVTHVRAAAYDNPTSVYMSSARVEPTAINTWQVFDFGVLQLPPAVNATYRLETWAARSTGSGTLSLDAIVLGALPSAAPDDLCGGDCKVTYGGSLSTGGFTGPITIDGTAEPPLATVTDSGSRKQPMRMAGEPPRLAVPGNNTLHVLTVSVNSTGTFAKAVGVAATGHTVSYSPRFVMLDDS